MFQLFSAGLMQFQVNRTFSIQLRADQDLVHQFIIFRAPLIKGCPFQQQHQENTQ